jgi:hypothetical protein
VDSYCQASGASLLGALQCAPVAQLDRAPDYESGGRTFESFRARHLSTLSVIPRRWFLLVAPAVFVCSRKSCSSREACIPSQDWNIIRTSCPIRLPPVPSCSGASTGCPSRGRQVFPIRLPRVMPESTERWAGGSCVESCTRLSGKGRRMPPAPAGSLPSARV